MRIIIKILLMQLMLLAAALPPNEAFVFSLENSAHFKSIHLKLDSSVYAYKNELKITHNGEDITKELDLKEPELKDGTPVFYKQIDINLPTFALKNKDNIKIFYLACSLEGLCYQPMAASFIYENNELREEYINKEARKIENDKSSYESALLTSSFLLNILSFFASGLLLSLTPCTLPMVPIISSILARSSAKKPVISSIVYVLGMSLSYTAAGVAAALLGSGVQAFFQSPVVIICFSLIFIILSLSMFGLYELKMPSFLVNKINQKSSNLSGVAGIFLMGALSALIVGPCVAAPLAGILIYIANTNDVILGASALFAMSIGMGIPLIAIGFGFRFITGAWMQNVNKFFGFVLLGIAIFFLERIIDEKIIYVLYAILGIAFCVFFGLFESARDKKMLFFKLILAVILCASFVLANKAFSEDEKSSQAEFVRASTELNLSKQNILYFTASWCENCKQMQKTTFKDAEVLNAFKNYNLIKIDLSSPNEFEQIMAQKYKVFGPPVLVKVNEKGEVLKQIVGLVDAKTLLKELDI